MNQTDILRIRDLYEHHQDYAYAQIEAEVFVITAGLTVGRARDLAIAFGISRPLPTKQAATAAILSKILSRKDSLSRANSIRPDLDPENKCSRCGTQLVGKHPGRFEPVICYSCRWHQ